MGAAQARLARLAAAATDLQTIVMEEALRCQRDAMASAPVKTGTLRRSIRAERLDPYTWRVGVWDGPATPYARIQDQGGQTRPHVIVPKRAKALRFQMNGSTVFAKSVNHPGSKIPGTKYLSNAYDAAVIRLVRRVKERLA